MFPKSTGRSPAPHHCMHCTAPLHALHCTTAPLLQCATVNCTNAPLPAGSHKSTLQCSTMLLSAVHTFLSSGGLFAGPYWIDGVIHPCPLHPEKWSYPCTRSIHWPCLDNMDCCVLKSAVYLLYWNVRLYPAGAHCTVHCTVHCTAHCTLHTAQCTAQCTAHCTAHCTTHWSALHCTHWSALHCTHCYALLCSAHTF
jgi:hypothetical protein